MRARRTPALELADLGPVQRGAEAELFLGEARPAAKTVRFSPKRAAMST